MGARQQQELPVPIQVEVKEKTAAEIVQDANESFKVRPPTVGLYLGSYGGPKGGGLFPMSEAPL